MQAQQLSSFRLLLASILLVASGCDFSALWGLDAPRPSLAPNDAFAVDPMCPELVVDFSALVLAPRVVTLTGQRANSGLGAESVPVLVQRGPCPPESDGGAEKASAQGAGKTPDAGTTAPVADRCFAGSAELDPVALDQLELIDLQDRGCRQRSPSLLECTLDARGEAAFGLVGHFPSDELSLGGFVPVCVTPLETSRDGAVRVTHRKELHAAPSTGTSRLFVAVVRLADPTAPSTAGGGCGSLVDCTTQRARAAFQAGIVSADVPSSDVRAGDLQPVRRDVMLHAALSMLDAPVSGAAFLSRSAACSVDDGGTLLQSVPLHITTGQSSSEVFFLCAAGNAAMYQIGASLSDVGPAADAGTASDAGVPTDGGMASTSPSVNLPIARPITVGLSALTQGFLAERSGSRYLVDALYCGGKQEPAPPDLVRVSGAPNVTVDGHVVIACDSSVMDEDAGSTSSSSLASSLDAALDCRNVTLAPTSGGTCHLEISPGH